VNFFTSCLSCLTWNFFTLKSQTLKPTTVTFFWRWLCLCFYQDGCYLILVRLMLQLLNF
jgi:hypothetical protein